MRQPATLRATVCLLLSLVAGNLPCSSTALGVIYVEFLQSADQPGIINVTSSLVATGIVVSTMEAPLLTSGYQFIDWTLNNVRRQDALGRSLNPVVFTITELTDAVARYVPATQDSVGDGILDWFRLRFFATTNVAALSDSDGDGFTLLDEYTRDYHPNMPDTIADGGIAQRSSGSILIIQDLNIAIYEAFSTPPGIVNLYQPVPVGRILVLPDVNITQNGYQFSQWMVNGVRMADVLGRSVGNLSIVIASNTSALAEFVSLTTDTAGDGVADWYKLQFYGTSGTLASSDTDGDGFTLLDEYNRDYHPNVPDTIADGGISQQSSPLIPVFNPNFATYTAVSTPPGLVNVQTVLLTNSTVLLLDVNGTISGYRFAQWVVNGVRVADALGRSVGNLSIVIASNTTAVAQFALPTASLANDGIPDWFKMQFYGATNTPSSSDTDGDGFTLLEEYNRDYHPNVPDTIADGGISQRSSELTFVDLRDYVFYKVTSNPTGFVDESGYKPIGTTITTTNFAGSTGAYVFGHWELNGIRQQGPSQHPLTQITFTLSVNNMATAVFYSASADSDADGMMDWWEDYYFGGPTFALPTTDTDGDGLNNLAEFLAGNDPHSATSAFRVVNAELTDIGFSLTFTTETNRLYRVEYTDTLPRTTNWDILLDDIDGKGNSVTVTDPVPTDLLQRFYRVKIK